MSTRVRIKRVYDTPSLEDGKRILVDRLWPRGVSKERAQVDFWTKATAPSDELRRWYRHDHAKWDEFRKRYFAELDGNHEAVDALVAQMDVDVVSFVFSSKETVLNNAAALREYLASRE